MLHKSVLLLILAGCFQISFLLMIIRRMREKLLRSKESNKQNEVFARPILYILHLRRIQTFYLVKNSKLTTLIWQ